MAAIRTLHRLECVLEAMHWALNQLSGMVPTWVQHHVPPAWYTRYGLRSDQARLPKDASKREALARQVGADGYQLLDWVQTADTLWASATSPPWRHSGQTASQHYLPPWGVKPTVLDRRNLSGFTHVDSQALRTL